MSPPGHTQLRESSPKTGRVGLGLREVEVLWPETQGSGDSLHWDSGKLGVLWAETQGSGGFPGLRLLEVGCSLG